MMSSYYQLLLSVLLGRCSSRAFHFVGSLVSSIYFNAFISSKKTLQSFTENPAIILACNKGPIQPNDEPSLDAYTNLILDCRSVELAAVPLAVKWPRLLHRAIGPINQNQALGQSIPTSKALIEVDHLILEVCNFPQHVPTP